MIGETGFEPATARPPARQVWARSVDQADIDWLSCGLVGLSFAQFVPQIVPRTRVRASARSDYACPPSPGDFSTKGAPEGAVAHAGPA